MPQPDMSECSGQLQDNQNPGSKRGRKPIHAVAMTPADRQREKRRREAEARARAEAQAQAEQERRRMRVAEIQAVCANILYQFALSENMAGDGEGRNILRSICTELSGRNIIP